MRVKVSIMPAPGNKEPDVAGSRSRLLNAASLGLILYAVLLGAAGGRMLNNEFRELTLEMYDHAIVLTHEISHARQEEARLRSEGLDEEVYTTVDERRNAELDWLDMQGELAGKIPPNVYARISDLDISEQPEAALREFQAARDYINSMMPAYLRLATSGCLMILVLLLNARARRQSRHGDVESVPLNNA